MLKFVQINKLPFFDTNFFQKFDVEKLDIEQYSILLHIYIYIYKYQIAYNLNKFYYFDNFKHMQL